MLCSTCSQPIKPIVAIDIDGTLGDYHGHFLRFADMYMGVTVTPWSELPGGDPYEGDVPFKVWFCETYDLPERTWYDIKLAYRQGGMKRSMPIYPGADRLISALRQLDLELWLTTTRPYLRLDNVDPDTRFWLDRHGIGYDGLLYDEDKYAVLAQRVDPHRVAAVLDDLPEQYEAAMRIYGPKVPIIAGTPYNHKVLIDGHIPTYCIGLNSALHAIRARVEAWRELYG